MKFLHIIFLCSFLCVSSASAQVEKGERKQEETFTDLESGKGMLDPENLSSLVQRGDVRAMNNVGLLWAKGFDGKQSFEEAVKWWNAAALRGYAVAMNNLGMAYANGHGVEKDIKQAFDWWLQSAMAGNAWAMNSVGDCYETGEGVVKDYVLAMSWYQTAADAGDPLAHFNVGALYQSGRGVTTSSVEAFSWFERGAFLGDPFSMQALARIYRDGDGQPSDLVEALAWYEVSLKRFKVHDEGDIRISKAESTELSAQLSQDDRKRAAERADFLTNLTKPAQDQQALEEGESRI